MRWHYRPGHPKANERGFVAGPDLGDDAEHYARNAPIMVDRFYEGVKTIDGTVDLGSRRKHRQYMKERGLAPGSDYSPQWLENRRKELAREEAKERREDVARAVWENFEGVRKR
jgi:hypothetical protein